MVISTISIKNFLLITLWSIPFIILLYLGLSILSSSSWLVFLPVPLIGLAIFLGQKFSKTLMRIDLAEGERFIINGLEILYEDVKGYFINDTGLTQTTLCLRLNTNKTIQITGSSVGEQGKEFRKIQKEIIETLKRKNQDLPELEYQNVYVRQMNVLRPVLYVFAGMIVIVDFASFYFLITGKMDMPWQIFFVNLCFIGLIPYLKRGKTTKVNQ